MATDSEIILGIDLGTTFSTAAACIDGKLHFVLDARGEACVPSVVHFPRSGPPLVGAEADRMRASDPQNTIWGIKRLIGRGADSPGARVLDMSSAITIKQVPGSAEAGVVVRGTVHGATEVASLLLRHLRARAEARFQRRIGKAVLTLPVTATPEVREAMIRCGKMAGLEVLRLLPEPVAGALAGGIEHSRADEKPLLVFDFGGGTFDATVVLREGERMRVLGAGGDECLGGDDFDLAFSRRVANYVQRHRGIDVTHDVILWDRIQRQCEAVKRALSTSVEARYRIADAFGGGERDLELPVRRDQVEAGWTELVERSVATALQTAFDAGVEREELGSLLLIGGTTHVPMVQRRVAEAFARPCVLEGDPQTAVARGAALLGARVRQLAN